MNQQSQDIKISLSSPDDNETVRYLATYLMENLEWDWDGAILSTDILYTLIKEFYDTLK